MTFLPTCLGITVAIPIAEASDIETRMTVGRTNTALVTINLATVTRHPSITALETLAIRTVSLIATIIAIVAIPVIITEIETDLTIELVRVIKITFVPAMLTTLTMWIRIPGRRIRTMATLISQRLRIPPLDLEDLLTMHLL